MVFECPECRESAQVSVSRVIPAKLYGPHESCYPAEGGEVDGVSEGDECPKCGYVVTGSDIDRLVELADEMRRERYEV
jgi:ssDNA-binding Zn-finger/Zn-ribbon topoisomerase 1